MLVDGVLNYSREGNVRLGGIYRSLGGGVGNGRIEFADGSTSQYERNTCAGYLV